MTTVILPGAPASGTTATASHGHTAVLATAPDPPPAVARLDPGSIITGTVLGRDAQGLVTIRTDKGVLALATNANLPPGSTVSLEVRVAGTRLQLVILSVELPGGAQPTSPAGPAGPPIPASVGGNGPASAHAPAAILAALSGDTLVTATVVHATQSPAVTVGHNAAVTAGVQPPSAGAGQLPAFPADTAPAGGRVPDAAAPAATAPSAAPASGQSGPGPQALPGAGAPGPAASSMPGTGQTDAGLAINPARTTAVSTAAPPAPDADAPSVPLAVAARPLPGKAAAPEAPVPLPVGAEVRLRILGAALPGSPAPALPQRPAAAPPVVAGVVSEETPAGHPVLDTPAGGLVLSMKAALPTGTILLLELPSVLVPTGIAAGPPAVTREQALLGLARGWSGLAEALAHLETAAEPAAAALAARLPQAGPRLAAGLMTAIARLAAGDVGEWLAPAVREALERTGRRDLVDRLRGEFQQLSRLASEPAGGDWRVMFLPFQAGQELHQINLYLRGRRRGQDGEALDTGTRFVVEVDMTRLGPIQLDGLVHGRRFDLVLRSRIALPAFMRRDIEAIFDEARAIGGYSGTIGFQVAARFPVAPLEQAKRKSAAGGLVV